MLSNDLRPVGYVKGLGMVVAEPLAHTSPSGLQQLAEEISEFPGVDAHLNNMVEVSDAAAENLPQLISTSFDPNTGGFDKQYNVPTPQGVRVWEIYRFHWQHFVMDTFAAHRLVEKAKTQTATATLAVIDSGYGNGLTGGNLSADLGSARFTAFTDFSRTGAPESVKVIDQMVDLAGSRVVIGLDGKRRREQRTGHGTAVLHFAAGSGALILGPGKDVDIHAMRTFILTGYPDRARSLAALEECAKLNTNTSTDDNIDVINYSLMTRWPISVGSVTENRLRKCFERISSGGGIVIIAAGNDATIAAINYPQYLVPERSYKRSKNLSMNVGASTCELVGGLGTEIHASSYSNTGSRVSVVAPGGQKDKAQLVKRTHEVDDLFQSQGTSYAAPMAAGLAAEMIYFDRALGRTRTNRQQFALKIVEMMEATADKLPNISDDKQGFGRINVWKAILAVANDGVAAESIPQTNNPFATLGNGLDDANTIWYGFEIRSNVQNATVWINTGVTPNKVTDVSAGLPAYKAPVAAGDIVAYKGLRNGDGPKVPRGVTVDVDGKATNGVFYTTFSIQRSYLVGGVLELRDPGAGSTTQPFYSLDLSNLPNMRSGTVTGSNNKAVTFDDFVFYVDAVVP